MSTLPAPISALVSPILTPSHTLMHVPSRRPSPPMREPTCTTSFTLTPAPTANTTSSAHAVPTPTPCETLRTQPAPTRHVDSTPSSVHVQTTSASANDIEMFVPLRPPSAISSPPSLSPTPHKTWTMQPTLPPATATPYHPTGHWHHAQMTKEGRKERGRDELEEEGEHCEEVSLIPGLAVKWPPSNTTPATPPRPAVGIHFWLGL
ncbi:uncharacterized protein F5891DRAFT_1184260 [Suillus fuscotomentosus]|uniref:Uncharacterized protein n=1 Tax=Suillus fuscotomentosus TaxID=1912939 RepID=A0AAD4HRG9_9AGAM|nr:uncharacterized protein F5891DRAFT_1184260 [Suillus fuscotomentosus]KAG1904844.1 hypothetical protein F5891DRAFT_1184260 [Suillus fuscotomentosus]